MLASIVLSAIAIVVSVGAVVFTRRSSQSSARSAVAAEHAQADKLGTDVRIDEPRPLTERWLVPDDESMHHPPAKTTVGEAFVMPGQRDIRLLMGVSMTVRNEGTRSVEVSIGAFRVDRCDENYGVEHVLSPPLNLEGSFIVAAGRLQLLPGASTELVVRQGPTLGEWVTQADQSQSPLVEIAASASPDGPTQLWRLNLSGSLLEQIPGDDSHYRALSHTPPTARLEHLPRRYPRDH